MTFKGNNMRTSKVIQMAASKPVYPKHMAYLCSVLYIMTEEGEISQADLTSARSAIKHSLNGEGFLRKHLLITGAIPDVLPYESKAYKDAAAQHWDALVKYLQVQERSYNVYRRHAPLHEIACDSWSRGFCKAQAYQEASNAGYALCVAVKEIDMIWERMEIGLAALEAKCTARPEDFRGTWK